MTTSQSFWTRKRQELQSQGILPPLRPSRLTPWWQDPEYTKPGNRVPAEEIHIADGVHDFSEAHHLRDKSGNCPNCGSSDYMSPSASAATRCFSCGYTHGRQVNDLDTMAITADVKTVKVKQAASAEGVRMGTSAAEINKANYTLALSENGKSYIDS